MWGLLVFVPKQIKNWGWIMKERTVSKRVAVICFFVVVALFCTTVVLFFGYYARGKTVGKIALSLKQAEANRVTAVKALEDCKKSSEERKDSVAKRQVAKPPMTAKKKALPVAKQAAPSVVAQVAVPNFGTTKLILRINVVEWSSVFQGKSLMSRDIGPIVRQGLANGTVVLAKEPLGFTVNGASVSVQGGHAIVDSGPINPETVLVVQPASGAKFASPPNGLPLTTNPGELDAVVKRGVSEIWLNFILAPAA